MKSEVSQDMESVLPTSYIEGPQTLLSVASDRGRSSCNKITDSLAIDNR
jgi:hypothetical protein